MQSLVTVLTSAGLASIIGIVITAMDASLGRSQHQKDVTVNEMKQARCQLADYDSKFKKANSLDDMFKVEAKIIAYLGQWSVNLRYRRISKGMTRYTLQSLLTRQYQILHDDIVIFSLSPEYTRSTRHTIKLFLDCDIISFKEVVRLWLHVKKLRKIIEQKH